jgi:hypothetical protein
MSHNARHKQQIIFHLRSSHRGIVDSTNNKKRIVNVYESDWRTQRSTSTMWHAGIMWRLKFKMYQEVLASVFNVVVMNYKRRGSQQFHLLLSIRHKVGNTRLIVQRVGYSACVRYSSWILAKTMEFPDLNYTSNKQSRSHFRRDWENRIPQTAQMGAKNLVHILWQFWLMSMLDPIICIPSFWQNCSYSLLYRYLLRTFTAEIDEMYPSVIFLEYKSQLSWSQAEGSFLGKSFEDGVLLGKDQSSRTLQSDSTSG